MNLRNFANFLFELGHLRQTPRSGWHYLRIKDIQNDAEHSARVGQIAFVLAVMENHPDPYYVSTMGLFHEIAEIRTNDPNYISRQYNVTDEDRAVVDQTAEIGSAGEKILSMWRECDDHKTAAGKIAKDADRLEMMFTAKEYISSGFPDAIDWFNSAFPLLETTSAKQIAEELKNMSGNEWWRSIRYKILKNK